MKGLIRRLGQLREALRVRQSMPLRLHLLLLIWSESGRLDLLHLESKQVEASLCLPLTLRHLLETSATAGILANCLSGHSAHIDQAAKAIQHVELSIPAQNGQMVGLSVDIHEGITDGG